MFGFNDSAQASYISLSPTISPKVAGHNLQVSVRAVNKGDESAFNVQAEVRAGGRTLTAAKTTELPVGGVYRADLSFPLTPQAPGSYPLVLTMHYTDGNQYPFSALTARTFVRQKEAFPPLSGRAAPLTFWQEGEIRFLLKNNGDRPLRVNLALIVPRELSAAADTREVVIEPRSVRQALFKVGNFSALSGSTYQVYLAGEFADGGLHYTSIMPGTIKIVERQTLFGLSYVTFAVVLAGLVVLFVGAQLIRR